MMYITTGQGRRDKETGEPDDATSIKSGSEGGWEKRPAMDLARSLPNNSTVSGGATQKPHLRPRAGVFCA